MLKSDHKIGAVDRILSFRCKEVDVQYHIASNYSRSCINFWSHLVTGGIMSGLK